MAVGVDELAEGAAAAMREGGVYNASLIVWTADNAATPHVRTARLRGHRHTRRLATLQATGSGAPCAAPQRLEGPGEGGG